MARLVRAAVPNALPAAESYSHCPRNASITRMASREALGMKSLCSARSALSISVAAALLAGCGGGQRAASVLPANAGYGKLQAIPAHGTSGQDLLYVGQYRFARGYIYSYPQGQHREHYPDVGG